MGRARHRGGSNVLFSDGHVKWIAGPPTSYTWTDHSTYLNIAPVEAQTGIVYEESINPNATGWFRETDAPASNM